MPDGFVIWRDDKRIGVVVASEIAAVSFDDVFEIVLKSGERVTFAGTPNVDLLADGFSEFLKEGD